MKKSYFLLILLASIGLFASQQVQAQCPTLDPAVGTPEYGNGIEVCVQPGGDFATITFSFVNDASNFDNFLLYDIANSSYLIEGLSPVTYVHTPGSNIWVIENVPNELVASINSVYVFTKVGCLTYGGAGIDIDPNDELTISDTDIVITNNTSCVNPFNGAIDITASGGYGAYAYSWTGPNGFTASTKNITALEPGIYNVVVSDGHNCSYTKDVEVLDNAVNPVVTINGLNSTYCESDAVVVINGSEAPSGTFSGPGITDNGDGTANFDPSSAGVGGDVIYTYTDLLGCVGDTVYSVLVNPIPTTPVATNNGPACEGENIQLSTPDVAGATFSWTGPNGFSSTLREPIVSGITGADAGIYSVTIVLLGCESLAGTTDVVVNPTLATPIATNDGPACEGNDLQLSTPDVPGATFSWTGPNGFTSSLREPVISGITIVGAGIYSVVTDDGTCPSLPGTTDVVVTPIPATPSATDDGPVCEGGNVQLSTPNVPGALYSWTGPNGFSSALRTPNISGITIAGTGTYYVTVTLSGCASLTGTTDVIINPIPTTPVATNNGPACEGEDIQLSTANVVGAIYSWTGPNGFSSTLREPTISDITTAEAGTYSVSITLLGCSSLDGTTDVIVNPTLATPTPTNNGPVCEGGDLQLTTANVPGATYIWIGPNGFSSSLREPIISGITTASAGAYSVVIDDGTCPSLPGVTNVVVNPIPSAPTPTNNGPVCEGGNLQLTTVDVPGATFSWTGPNGFSSALREPIISGMTAAGAGSYSVMVTLSGCASLAGSTNVIVNPTLATPTATNNGPVCEGDDVQLSTPDVPGATYAWVGPNGFSSNLREPIVSGITLTGAGTYSVMLSMSGCTSLAGTTDIVVNPTPIPIIAGNSNPACQATGQIYSVQSNIGSTYNWTVPAGAVITSGGGTNSIVVDFGSTNGIISVQEQNASGCISAVTTMTIVQSGCVFDADFLTFSLSACINNTITFTSISSGTDATTTYSWNFGANATPATANTEGPHDITYSTSGLKTISLTIDDGNGNVITETKTDYINVVNPVVANISVSGSNPICPGQATDLTLQFVGGLPPYYVTYTDGSSTYNLTVNVGNDTTISVSPIVNTDYNLVSVSDNNCSGTVNPAPAEVLVNPLSDVMIQIDDAIGSPGASIAIPVRINGFQSMTKMNFTISWDANLISYDAVENVSLPNTNLGLAEVGNGFLSFTWNSSLADTTIIDGQELFSMRFNINDVLCTDAILTVDETPSTLVPMEIGNASCDASVTIDDGVVDIQATASMTSSDPDNLICFGETVIFTGLPTSMVNYKFYVNNVLTQDGVNPTYINAVLVDQDEVRATITDLNGCTTDVGPIVTTVTQISATTNITQITACGLSDGAIEITSVTGGVGPYTYLWTDPSINGGNETLQNQSNLARGIYNVTITDGTSGCIEVMSFNIQEPANFTLSTTKQDVTAMGGNDGEINLTITGGSGNNTISWTGPGGFTSNQLAISGLVAGNYIADVLDNVSGCGDFIEVEILEPTNVLTLNFTKTDVSACGASDGTIDLTVSGGSGNYAISWLADNDPGFTSNSTNLTGLSTDDYQVTVTDIVTAEVANLVVSIVDPLGTTLSAGVVDMATCVSNDGEIALTVSGGVGPFTFSWIDLDGNGFTSSDQNLTGLMAGNYRVEVQDDATSCTSTLDVVVGKPAFCDLPCAFNVSVSTNPTNCADSINGSATIFVINGGSGDGNYFYSLDNGTSYMPFDGDFLAEIENLGQGNYPMVVRDSVTGCTDNVIANVGVSSTLAAELSMDEADCDGKNGKISMSVSGKSPFEVKLVYKDGTEFIQTGSGLFTFDNLDSGAYSYTIKEDINNNGCEIMAPDSISLGSDCPTGCSSLAAIAHSFEDATCSSEPNGKAIVDVSGGASPYEYTADGINWIPFISGNIIDQLPPNGTYNIDIRQSEVNADCRTQVQVVINGPDPIELKMPIITMVQASCNLNDGVVKLGEVVGGISPYTYLIDDVAFIMPSDSMLTGLGAGSHILGVIDAVGCREDFDFVVDSPGGVFATVTDVPVSCTSIFLKAGIRIEMDLPATTLPGPYEAYVASSSDPDNGTMYQIPDNGIRTILNLDKDFYDVTIRASIDGGCTYSETISVFSGAYSLDFEIMENDSIVSCIGGMGSITIGNVTGDPDTTYIVQLVSEGDVVLETFNLTKFELEGGFTIDESNTDKLVGGNYYIKMIQNQDGCADVEAVSGLITIYEPLGQLGLDVIEDAVSLSDRPTGSITVEVIPSGGTPYEVLVQLVDPVFELNITDIIDFNEQRNWEVVTSSGGNLNRYTIKLDTLWAGLYEIFVRDAYGCEYSLDHSIDYDETIFIPNVFTPNNDGVNDDFYIRNLPESGTSVIITNRNGSIVYESDNYTYDTLWDGGNEADGIYYYKVSMSTGENFKGWVEKWSGTRP